MDHVFGPVPSRRLGNSLGIDPVPFKTCNWNCVYCQLGRTTPMTGKRSDFYPPGEILTEVRNALSRHRQGAIDWVTFLGSGEPTLYASLGSLIRKVRTLTGIPIAVLTNGSLLCREEVRQELLAADAVLPSLDAGTHDLFRTINRPFPGFTLENQVEGLEAFRNSFSGKLWIEVMLVKGLNDTEKDLKDLSKSLQRIRPDEVHINLPVRPPCEPWVEPPGRRQVDLALAILGSNARYIHPVKEHFDFSGSRTAAATIERIIARHPLSEDELFQGFNQLEPGQAAAAVAELASNGRAQIIERFGKRYWCSARARFGGRKDFSREK